MKKNVIIISVIVCILIILTSIGIYIKLKRSENTQAAEKSIVETENVNIEEPKEESGIESVEQEFENVNHENENIKKESNKNETINNNSSVTKKDSEKATINNTTKTTDNETKEINKKNTKISKEDVPSTNDKTMSETKVNEKTIRCTTNNNHGMGVGNSNKWFNSKQEAINYYQSIIKKWGDKWEKFEIDDETYQKNCPYGYETWSCQFCGKWTINFYYN